MPLPHFKPGWNSLASLNALVDQGNTNAGALAGVQRSGREGAHLEHGFFAAVGLAGGTDGEYAFAEQYRNASGTWVSVVDGRGTAAQDVAEEANARPDVAEDSLVWMWEFTDDGGTIHYLFAAPAEAGGAGDPGYPGDSLMILCRVNVSANGTVTLNVSDWRDRAIWISYSIDAGGDNSFTAHGVRSGADYMGVVQEFHGGAEVDYILCTGEVGGGFGDFKINVDGADETYPGKLKFTSMNYAASPDPYTVVVWGRASGAITVPSHLIN